MKNFIFITPNFPTNYWQFCKELKNNGLNVLGIGDAPYEELAQELKEKYTIVIVTHNMQQAVRISDYTAFFLLGELVEFGETERMFSQPMDKRTEDYITGRFG